MDFEVGQMVKIVRQSQTVNRHIPMEGLIGVIEELQEFEGESLIAFREVKLNSSAGGSGAVPVSCIEPYSDPRYEEARERWDHEREEYIASVMAESERRKEAEQKALEITAEKWDLMPGQVKALMETYEDALKELGFYD